MYDTTGVLQGYIAGLQEKHDDNEEYAAERMLGGSSTEELAVVWAYSSGLQFAIRTLQEAIKRGDL